MPKIRTETVTVDSGVVDRRNQTKKKKKKDHTLLSPQVETGCLYINKSQIFHLLES